jgi:hypothetical protein
MRTKKMSKVHHFVVSFDEATGKWKWDTDSEEARFEDGTIYNPENDEWSNGYLGDGIYEPNEEILVEQIKHSMWVMNLVNGKVSDGADNG